MAVEIERKFLVPTLPPDLPKPSHICQGYLLDHPERIVRIRTSGTRGILTIKGKTDTLARPEFEYPIPLADAQTMLATLCLRPLVEKLRYTLAFEGMEWVIDRFLGENQGLVVAEIELASEDQPVSLPPWAGKEVTHDPRYLNASLVKAPYTTWTD